MSELDREIEALRALQIELAIALTPLVQKYSQQLATCLPGLYQAYRQKQVPSYILLAYLVEHHIAVIQLLEMEQMADGHNHDAIPDSN